MSEHIRTVTLLGVTVDVSGFYTPTSTNSMPAELPTAEFDGIDLYVEGECINEGSCFYTSPTDEQILPFVREHLETA